MAKIIKVKAGEHEFDAIEVQFEIGQENWNEYKLLDGGVVRVKTSVGKIFRVVDSDGKPTVTPEGDPHVIVRHKTEVVASD